MGKGQRRSGAPGEAPRCSPQAGRCPDPPGPCPGPASEPLRFRPPGEPLPPAGPRSRCGQGRGPWTSRRNRFGFLHLPRQNRRARVPTPPWRGPPPRQPGRSALDPDQGEALAPRARRGPEGRGRRACQDGPLLGPPVRGTHGRSALADNKASRPLDSSRFAAKDAGTRPCGHWPGRGGQAHSVVEALAPLRHVGGTDPDIPLADDARAVEPGCRRRAVAWAEHPAPQWNQVGQASRLRGAGNERRAGAKGRSAGSEGYVVFKALFGRAGNRTWSPTSSTVCWSCHRASGSSRSRCCRRWASWRPRTRSSRSWTCSSRMCGAPLCSRDAVPQP